MIAQLFGTYKKMTPSDEAAATLVLRSKPNQPEYMTVKQAATHQNKRDPMIIPCETCGKPTSYGLKLCNNCWEVENRLPAYLRSSKALEFVRKHSPLLDDWADAWDFEKVLADNEVTVEWSDTLIDGDGNESPAGDFATWSLGWKHGTIGIGRTTETIARKAAALFVSLWLRGVSASFADKLMDGYIVFLERQEGLSLTFLTEIDQYGDARPYLCLTREGWPRPRTAFTNIEWQIIEALDTQPDEEIIITFTKRKR